MAMLSGFDSNAMFRLNQHVERLRLPSRETFTALRDLCVATENFTELRKKYEEALHASKPILPCSRFKKVVTLKKGGNTDHGR
jgi:hypothetical protein